jgi:hypothetical protein
VGDGYSLGAWTLGALKSEESLVAGTGDKGLPGDFGTNTLELL